MTFLTRFSLKNAAAVFVCSFLLMFLGLAGGGGRCDQTGRCGDAETRRQG